MSEAAGHTTLLTAVGYGRPVGLRVPSAELDAARGWLPWWWREEPVEPERVWEADSAAACEWVVRELELWVAEHAEGFVFVHAGVVAVGGSALLLPGRSFAGKSTLVLELLRAGAAYLSDEYAVLGPDGVVHPYPRPISLRRPDGTRPRVTAAEAGAGVSGPVPVAAVAALVRREGASIELRDMAPGDAVLALIDNAVAAQRVPADVLDAAVRVVQGARCWTGERGDADLAAAALLSRLR